MKRSTRIFFIVLLSIGMQPIMQAAITDWVREKTQKARQAFYDKTVEAQQLTRQLQESLKSNTDCLMQGTCQPGQRDKLLLLAKQVGVAVIALIVLATAAVVASKMVDTSPRQLTQGEMGRKVSIQEIAQKFGVTIPLDDSPPSIFIRAVQNGVVPMVKEFADLVSDKVLQVGKELAQAQHAFFANEEVKEIRERLQKQYKEIENYVSQTLQKYNPNNWLFIYAATTGLLKEVQERLCSNVLMPTKNAIQEAIRQVKAKVATSDTFKEIMNFITNPRCEKQ